MKLTRFTNKVVSLAKKAVGDSHEPPVQKGEGGYDDWIIAGLHSLQKYLGYRYRRLIDVLYEMPGIVAKFGVSVDKLPDFITVCAEPGSRNAGLAGLASAVGTAAENG